MAQDQDEKPTITSRTPGLELNHGIYQRGREMYLNPNPSKPRDAGRGKSNLESAIGVLSTLGNVSNWANPVGLVTGVVAPILQNSSIRTSKIEDLAGNKAFLQGYKSDSNTYKGLDWITRTLYNIKPDDITGQRIFDRGEDLLNSPGVRVLADEFPEKNAGEFLPQGALTSSGRINNQVREIATRNDLLSEINSSTMGPGILQRERDANPDRRLTNDELRRLRAEAKTTDPVYVEARGAAEDQSDLVASNIQTNESTARVNEGNLALSQLQERNTNRLRNAEIDLANDKLDYEWRNANANRDYEWRAAEADRDLKKTLSMLGLEDKADARRERSEEREAQNRQMFILQLMKGLGSLGQSIAY